MPANRSNHALKAILGASPVVVPLIALFLLIPAPIAAYRQYRDRRLLDTQKALTSIRALAGRQFEALVAEASRRQGSPVLRNSGDGSDGGVDLTLKKEGA